jgi:type I restriction-modification system DNA methylase subunit
MATKLFDFTEKNGLVSCSKVKSVQNNAELLHVHEARRLGASAVFFRRFYRDGETLPYNSEPAVCIFEKEDAFFNSEEHIRLHAALWSGGRSEVYVIISKLRIDILNARRPAQVTSDRTLSLEELVLISSDAVKAFNDARFSAYLFESGTFWEQDAFKDEIDVDSSPYRFLLSYLMTVRGQFMKNNRKLQLRPETIDKLLVTSILVKFLEEIKDDKGKHTLKAIYKNYQVKNFAEVISNGFLLNVYDELATEFNGKIFDRFSREERKEIADSDLNPLVKFLRADVDVNTDQMFLWEQYSFKYLPAEVISAIYENFIQAESVRQSGKTEKGIVYTPIHLVNLLVDEVMPLDKPELFANESFKILDPACGSGVFLVAAYKRMLQWWAINNYNEETGLRFPQSKKAQAIIERNIFGIDVKETATLVSIFGLTTALLDKLTPQAIWNNFQFKDLSENNILCCNFFDKAIDFKNAHTFDLVIGNPPFNIESGQLKSKIIPKELINVIGFKHKHIPNKNFALYFLEASFVISKKVCLILPANVFLYSTAAQGYRTGIFTDFTVQKILDFTHLRRELFHKTADTPVIALIALNIPNTQSPIEHIVIKRGGIAGKKLRFETDYYDHHMVSWAWAIDPNKNFVWKTNLLGGGRLFHLIQKLSQLRSLEQFIVSMKKETNNEWEYSVGYLVGDVITNPKRNVNYIHGKPSIISETFDDSESFEIEIETNRDFEAPRDPKIYEPPHLILKANAGIKNIPIHYSEKYLCFKKKLIGIHAPVKHKDLLKEIYNRFKDENYSKLFRLWIFSTSAETLVNLETGCNKQDIDFLPYPEDIKYLKLNRNERAIQNDVLEYYIHLGKSINEVGAGSALVEKVAVSQLKSFGRFFIGVLNDLYAVEDKAWQIGLATTEGDLTTYVFCFGSNAPIKDSLIEEFKGKAHALISETLVNSRAACKRIVRIYKHISGYDCVVFIKPNLNKYWLNSIALRDADDTIVDFKKAGF